MTDRNKLWPWQLREGPGWRTWIDYDPDRVIKWRSYYKCVWCTPERNYKSFTFAWGARRYARRQAKRFAKVNNFNAPGWEKNV